MPKKNNRRPTYLRVLNLDYMVVWVESTYCAAAGASGWCDRAAQEIYINSELTDRNTVDTFFHEVLHAIIWGMGIRVSEAELTEEQYVLATTTGVLKVWQDNPEAFEWMKGLLL